MTFLDGTAPDFSNTPHIIIITLRTSGFNEYMMVYHIFNSLLLIVKNISQMTSRRDHVAKIIRKMKKDIYWKFILKIKPILKLIMPFLEIFDFLFWISCRGDSYSKIDPFLILILRLKCRVGDAGVSPVNVCLFFCCLKILNLS